MQQVTVLPSDVLLVGFDMTHGEGNEICIVGKKEGKTITVVNAFGGREAIDIFNKLTTLNEKMEEKR